MTNRIKYFRLTMYGTNLVMKNELVGGVGSEAKSSGTTRAFSPVESISKSW